MKTTQQPQDWREGRRLRGGELQQHGWGQTKLAPALGVSQRAVSQWIARGRAGGPAARQPRKPTGAPPRVSDTQRVRLVARLKAGAPADGFVGESWTQARSAVLIKRACGVRYQRDQSGRLLRARGGSLQQPSAHATHRADAAVERWRREQGPPITQTRTAQRGP